MISQYNPKQSCIILSQLTLMVLERGNSALDCTTKHLFWMLYYFVFFNY